MSMSDFGDFAPLAPLMVVHQRLQEAMLDTDLVWVLPASVLPGVTSAWGLPVVRADVERPMLAHVLAEEAAESGSQGGSDV